MFASQMRNRQIQFLAQEVDQCQANFQLALIRCAIDGDGYPIHRPLLWRGSAKGPRRGPLADSGHLRLLAWLPLAVDMEKKIRYVTFVGEKVGLQWCLRVNSEPEPDIAVVAGRPSDYAASHPSTALLAVEITVTTLAYDRDVKGPLYARAEIPNFWLIDVPERRVTVFRRLALGRGESQRQ